MSFSDRDGTIWSDGELIPWRDAKTHLLTHTLHYGLGVFEGVRAYETDQGAAIFRLDDHTKRLHNSGKILNMKMPYDLATLNKAQIDVVRENNLDSGYLRPMAYYGSEGMGIRADMLETHVMVAAWAWGAYLGDDAIQNGIKVRTSSYTRHHVNSTMSQAKACGNYINSILALQEAIASGAQEALLLDASGFVMEGSGENVFLVKDGVLYTPDITSALDGITRQTIMQLAEELGYQVKECRITRDQVYLADEAFFTGTAAEVTPIQSLDDRIIGSGGRGPITERLQTLYFDVVNGRSKAHQHWLTYVE
ncbi:MAG: branched-chain amino acid transaminase [Arenicellales bacterium]